MVIKLWLTKYNPMYRVDNRNIRLINVHQFSRLIMQAAPLIRILHRRVRCLRNALYIYICKIDYNAQIEPLIVHQSIIRALIARARIVCDNLTNAP